MTLSIKLHSLTHTVISWDCVVNVVERIIGVIYIKRGWEKLLGDKDDFIICIRFIKPKLIV